MSDNGGPAFPRPLDPYPNVQGLSLASAIPQSGMSLRDYFAGQALIGALITAQIIDATTPGIDPAEIGESARDAYRIADEMLKVRQP